jgi:putative transposase
MQVQSSELEYAYKREKDARVKERMLLIMLIKEGKMPAHAARELHRAKSWAYTWRDRYEAEGIEGLKDKPRSGRPPRISQKVQMSIRKELRSYPYGWKTREVMRLIYKRAGVVYSETHICRLLQKWGFKRKVPIKSHFSTASMEEKEDFKKRLLR